MDDIKTLTSEHEEMVSERARFEPRWRDLARILRPDENEFSAHENRKDEVSETFDSTPLYAHEEFVTGLSSEAMNPADRWFEFDIEDKELAKFKPVKQWLRDGADAVYASLAPQRATFYPEATAAFGDLAAFGPGCLYQEEDVASGRIVDRAMPIGRVWVRRDAFGFVTAVHSAEHLTGRQMKARWRNATEARDDTTYCVLHCVRPNADDYQPGRLGPGGMRFRSTFFSPELRDKWRVDGGYHELPYHFFEWDRRPGRGYARGPGHMAFADMNMLDEQQRSVLTALMFEAEPMILTRDDGILEAADIAPHAVIAGGISDQGKALAQRLDRGENLHLPMAATEATRNAIKEAFKFSLMSIVNRPQMTLGEFAGWKEEKLKAMAPHLVRVQAGQVSFIQRRFNLLARAKKIPPPPPEIAQSWPPKIEFVSPFAKAMQLAQARGAMQFAGGLMQVAELRPDVMDNLNVDAYARKLHTGFSNDPDLINDPRQVEGIRKARAAQQQQMLQTEQAERMAGVVADVSHAKQASQRADMRSKVA